jgi:hypothetical protein
MRRRKTEFLPVRYRVPPPRLPCASRNPTPPPVAEIAVIAATTADESACASSSYERDCCTAIAASSTASSASGRVIPRSLARGDAPVVKHTTRGSIGTALATAGDDSRKRKALEDLHLDVDANSSRSTKASLLSAWTKLHAAWFGECIPVFPLTPCSIYAVASLFKVAGYRSYANYLSRSKTEHISLNYEWTPQLHLAERRSLRSVLRGIGPPRQTHEFDLGRAYAAIAHDRPLVPDGPIGARNWCVFASFHLLREIELSLVLVEHVVLDTSNLTETVSLPVSKTDPVAHGCTRTWGCVCKGSLSEPCPYHAVCAQLELLSAKFGVGKGELPEGLPLFPNSAGRIVSKEAVVASVEAIASLLGEPLKTATGENRFGGHVFRIIGARRLAAMGIQVAVIMLLARWSSNVVLRYIKDSPLKALTSEYIARGSFTKPRSEAASENMGLVPASVLTQIKALAESHEKQSQEVALLAASVRDSSSMMKPYVVNLTTGVWHKSNSNIEAPPLSWRSNCGWRFAMLPFSRANHLPEDVSWSRICNRCLRFERTARKSTKSGEESESSSDTSE